MVIIIISSTKRVISPRIRFLLSISPPFLPTKGACVYYNIKPVHFLEGVGEKLLTFALSFCFLTFDFLLFSARCTVRWLRPKSSAISLTLLPLRLSSAIRVFRAVILSLCCLLGCSSTHLGSGHFKHEG